MNPNDRKFWEAIDEAYEDFGMILRHIDQPDTQHGDGLAEFIVRELKQAEDLTDAIIMMRRAERELTSVLVAVVKFRAAQSNNNPNKNAKEVQ